MRTSLLSADELATHTPAQGMPSPLLPPELPPQTPPEQPPEASPPPAEGGKGGSEEIKLPWGILFLVYGVLMSDAIASTVITPFVPDMCSKRFGISEENVGMAAGALIGAYNLASFVSSFMLGHLADKYGRKLIVMGGLLSGAVGTILFGFSPNFALAFASRLLAGFFNANIAVARAVCADVTEGQARILAFAYTAACFNLSRSLSSGIGGAFTIIDFSGVPMLADNPFLFPCLVGGAFNFVSLLTVLFFLPETSKRVQEHHQGKSKQSLREGLKSFKDWLMTKLIFTYSIGSFCNGGLLVAMVLFYSLQVEHRGLGFDPLLNGLAFALFSTTGFFFQIFAFERMLKWLGVVNLYLLSSLLLCLGVLLLPCVTFIYWGLGVSTVSTVLVWIALAVIVCCLLATGFMCFLSTLGAMVSNACEDSIQGLTMGMNQSVSSLLRALGPFVVGMVFSAGVAIKFPFFGFWILGVLYFCCFLFLFWLSPLERFRVGDTSAALADLKSKAAEGEAENRPLLPTAVISGER